jgi:hypothetical protein
LEAVTAFELDKSTYRLDEVPDFPVFYFQEAGQMGEAVSQVVGYPVSLGTVVFGVVCFVGGWYGHMKLGKQAQALVDEVKKELP